MTEELSDLQKAMYHTKEKFLITARKATKELERQQKRLKKEISQANARAKRTRIQIQGKTERLVKSTATKTKRELNKQITNLEKILDGAKKEASELRQNLAPVKDDLTNARNHLAHALHIDSALAKIQRVLKPKPPTKKKTTRKKATKKKAVRKKPAGKKVVRRKSAAGSKGAAAK